MDFEKSFDELLNGILTDYRNQFPDADLSQGSLLFIKSACLASVAWGLSRHIAWTCDQIFPDTSDPANLYHHGSIVAVDLLPGESDADYLARVQYAEQKPLAGGNRYDYINWARAVEGVHRAWCYPIARGTGTVDVVITTDPATGTELADAELLASVKEYIDARRPVGRGDDAVQVFTPIPALTDVTMTGLGAADPDVVAAEISAYIATFEPAQPLYLVQLKAIAINNGALNPTVTAPAADVVPAGYHMIRPGAINVSA